MIKIAINGICGRMGKRILRLAKQDRQIEVVVGFEQKDHPNLDGQIEEVDITSDYKLLKSCDIVIDFTNPAATVAVLKEAVKLGKSLVVGTTGLSGEQEDQIKEAARSIPLIYSPNMSIGINLFFKVLKLASSTLAKHKVKIEEVHHVHKKDAPSGTAKKLAEIVNEFGLGVADKDITAKREGEVIGDHEVIFEDDFDSFKISHHAKTRDIFAQGALTAAKWIKAKPKRLYSMEDVLFE